MSEKWTEMTPDAAERLARETGRPVLWAADAVSGFARPLAEGETEAQALADFEAAGEPVERHELYEVA